MSLLSARQASDGAAESPAATVTLRIAPVNDAPAAVSDTAATTENTPVVINVLSNDTDIDGDTVTVSSVSEAVGDAGFVVPPRDHAAVANAYVKLLQDAPLRRQLGLAARQRVLENFTLQKWNDTYRGIYTELVTR